MLLKGRVAIVTGGSSGIGRGIALEFGREGASVASADIQESPKRGKYFETDTTTSTVEEIEKLGSSSIFVQMDVADEAAVRHMVEETVAHFDGVDILVNNAAIHIPGSIQELSVDDWDRVLAINLRGVFLTTKFALPYLKKSPAGRIINIASVYAFGGGAGPAYAPAKAGMVNLTRDTALEVAKYRITVNAICPGAIETANQDYLTDSQLVAAREATPLRRLGTPRDIGRAAVFLASDDADWMTGVALPVDGGCLASVFPGAE